MHYTLFVVTVGTIFSLNMNLFKNKNIEDEKIKHIYISEKFVFVIAIFLFLVSPATNHYLKICSYLSTLPRTAFFIEHLRGRCFCFFLKVQKQAR